MSLLYLPFQEVTSLKDQAQYWCDESRAHSFVPAEAFDAAFKDSTAGREKQALLAVSRGRGVHRGRKWDIR